MLVLENDLHWQRTWWLLSLDDVRALAEELWIPADAMRLSAGLRTTLEAWMLKADAYLADPPSASYDLFRRIEQSTSSEELQLLVAWGWNVGVGPRHTRIEQWTWRYVINTIRTGHAKAHAIDPWIVTLCERVRAAEVSLEQRVNPKVAAQFDRPVTDWDVKAHRLQDVDRDSVKVDVTAIVNHNVFAYAWESTAASLTRSQLQQLYDVPKEIATEGGLDRNGLTFPGSWRFPLLPFLERARAAWH